MKTRTATVRASSHTREVASSRTRRPKRNSLYTLSTRAARKSDSAAAAPPVIPPAPAAMPDAPSANETIIGMAVRRSTHDWNERR